MPSPDGFPHELLAQPLAARLAYFAGKIVAHPHLKQVHQTLMTALHRPAGAALILVYGPTGVGKTTLRLRVEKQLTEEALPALAQDRGRLPVVGLEAVAPESGNFNWKDFYTRALIALDEPLIGQKVVYGGPDLCRDDQGRLVVARPVAAAKLRYALEQCLRQRRPAALLIDEAQHLKKMASGRRLLDQMDTLKSLAGQTGTLHVLIGTYELLSLTNLSAQLSRRSIEIAFPHYRAEREEEFRAFRSVLLTFQRHLPLAEEPDLVGRADYFYERSVGCVGVLKNWLTRALAAALEVGQTTLPDQYLDEQAEPTRNLLRMAREIREGEEALREKEDEQAQVRALLGLPPSSAPLSPVESASPEAPRPAETGPRRPPGRVGQRRPTRDPVGGADHAG